MAISRLKPAHGKKEGGKHVYAQASQKGEGGGGLPVHVNNTGGEDVSLEIHHDGTLGCLDLTANSNNQTTIDQDIALVGLVHTIKNVSILEQGGCSAIDETGVGLAGLGQWVLVLVLTVDGLALVQAVHKVTSRDADLLIMDLVVRELVGGTQVEGGGGEKGDRGGRKDNRGLLVLAEELALGLRVSVSNLLLVVLREGRVVSHG